MLKLENTDDLNLMTRLRNAGTDHRKFMRISRRLYIGSMVSFCQ